MYFTSFRKEAGPKKNPAATKGAYFGTSGILWSNAILDPRRIICHSEYKGNKNNELMISVYICNRSIEAQTN